MSNRKITISFDVNEDEAKMLAFANCDRPDGLHVKNMLLSMARQQGRRFIDDVYNRSVNRRVKTIQWRNIDEEPTLESLLGRNDRHDTWLGEENIRNIKKTAPKG